MASWWNPFKSGSSARDSTAKLASTPERQVAETRRIQERKDATLALLATEFRRLSNAAASEASNSEPPSASTAKTRDELIDMAFQELEKKNLDELSTIQLRQELHTALKDQVVDIFNAFVAVDKVLPPFDPDQDSGTKNVTFETILNNELDHVVAESTNPSSYAPKGSDPNIFFQLKQGALQTLLDRRRRPLAVDSSTSQEGQRGETHQESNSATENRNWVEADFFGYHESIDEEMNQLVRYYQMINLCRSAKLRHELGYSVIALKSCIPGAGRGVFVDGFAKAGSILAFQPGAVWPKEHLLNMTFEEEREMQNNDNYQLSLRPDDHLIDSRKSPYTVLTEKNSNPMALGHVVNHPTPSMPPNCRSIMVNFVKDMDLDPHYIPNTYARRPTLTSMGSLWDSQPIDMHGMCLLATRDVCNEEIFYDYRLMTSHMPRWYSPVQDTHFVETDKEG